jgi:GNAT superfamily N-acetyltransferase
MHAYEDLSAKAKIIKAMEENLFAHMLFFPEHADVSTVVKARGMTIIDGHIDNDSFNLVANVRLDEEALDAIESAVNYFRRERAPFAWWVSPGDRPNDLAELLPHVGLRLAEQQIGMYAELENNVMEQGLLRVERILDSAGFEDFIAIVRRGLQDDTFAEYYGRLLDFPFMAQDYEQLYVGYLDEEPVSCALLTLHSDVAGIHSLVTVPEQRKKGFGSAMMQELMMRAEMQGYALVVLQAEQARVPFYERFGFEPLCEFKVFSDS